MSSSGFITWPFMTSMKINYYFHSRQIRKYKKYKQAIIITKDLAYHLLALWKLTPRAFPFYTLQIHGNNIFLKKGLRTLIPRAIIVIFFTLYNIFKLYSLYCVPGLMPTLNFRLKLLVYFCQFLQSYRDWPLTWLSEKGVSMVYYFWLQKIETLKWFLITLLLFSRC